MNAFKRVASTPPSGDCGSLHLYRICILILPSSFRTNHFELNNLDLVMKSHFNLVFQKIKMGFIHVQLMRLNLTKKKNQVSFELRRSLVFQASCSGVSTCAATVNR